VKLINSFISAWNNKIRAKSPVPLVHIFIIR